MTTQLSHFMLIDAQKQLVKVNEHLGRRVGYPNGQVDPAASEQDLALHAALVDLTEALEHFSNWATELSVRLEDAGIVDLARVAP